ncbi:MAG TPA: hypothetical protein VFZ98_13475 [Vicinamibacterales bacterium]
MSRGSFVLALGLAVVSAGFVETGPFSGFPPASASTITPDNAATREQEWIISEIARSMLNVAAYAGHFDAGDPFQVRNIGKDPTGAQRFRLSRGAEEYTVTTDRPWTPEPYVRMARSLMADGAGLSVTEDAVTDRVDAAGAQAVSRLLQTHPRSGAVHERAALLLGLSVKKREVASATFDPRPALCLMTAHLAISRALHPAGLTKDGRTAEQVLATLSAKQPEGAAPPASAGHQAFWVVEQ